MARLTNYFLFFHATFTKSLSWEYDKVLFDHIKALLTWQIGGLPVAALESSGEEVLASIASPNPPTAVCGIFQK